MAVIHKNLTGDEAIHDIMYVTSSDPGAVGAFKFWLDTTGGATLTAGAILKQRDSGNASWTTRADVKTSLDLKLTASSNLSDVANAATARTNLGVDTAIAAAVAGLSWKQAVRAATTANGTLATAFANGQAIDGVTLATGDRILVKNQSSASENGIYIVAASGAPSRATDADSGAELLNATLMVEEGTTNGDTQWTCTTNATITLGSTSLAFTQIGVGGASGTAGGDLTGTYPNPTIKASVALTTPTIVATPAANDNSHAVPDTAYVDRAVAAGPGGSGSFALLCDSTLGSAQASLDTNTILGGNISGSYKNLRIVIQVRSARAASADELYVRLNHDSTAAAYQWGMMWMNSSNVSAAYGSTGTGFKPSATTVPGASQTSSHACHIIIDIPDYAGSTFSKHMHTTGQGHDGTGPYSFVGSCMWDNAAAITRFEVLSFNAANLDVGSRLTVYGY